MIPALCQHRGRALYLDADMLVLGDVAELADMPLGSRKLLCSAPAATDEWAGHGPIDNFGARTAVMLLDCERLGWDIDEIVAGLDEGRYSYEELMSDLCVVEPDEIADTIPPEWNDLERYDPTTTKLLHYTVVPTQPWRNDENPLGEIWTSWYRDAVEAGAVPPEEVESLIAARKVKPSLREALRLAPSRRAVLTNASLDLITAQQRIKALESRIEAMEDSSSWRIGSALVRGLKSPMKLVPHRTRPR